MLLTAFLCVLFSGIETLLPFVFICLNHSFLLEDFYPYNCITIFGLESLYHCPIFTIFPAFQHINASKFDFYVAFLGKVGYTTRFYLNIHLLTGQQKDYWTRLLKREDRPLAFIMAMDPEMQFRKS